MIRETRFLISRKPYAVDLGSLRIQEHTRPRQHGGGCYYSGRIDAVWFRRRKGVTVACIGILWDSQDTRPADGHAFLLGHDDGRYGGDCLGRWDGSGYWGSENPDVMAEHLALLRPMLADYEQDPKNPALPAGFDGWWRF